MSAHIHIGNYVFLKKNIERLEYSFDFTGRRYIYYIQVIFTNREKKQIEINDWLEFNAIAKELCKPTYEGL